MRRWLILALCSLLMFCALVPAQQVRRRPIVAGATEPLLTGLVAYWALEEASGTRVDATGRGNDLADNNTVTQTTGKVGNAALFTAANSEYLSHADNADLSMGDIDWTFVFWVNLVTDCPPNGFMVIAKDVDTPANSRDYTVDIQDDTGNNIARHYINGGGTALVAATTFGDIATGTWRMGVVKHNASADTLTISIDNGAADSDPTTGIVPQDSGAEFRMGARAFATFEGYMNGGIDEVGMWKRSLSAGEITRLWNSGAGCSYPFSGCP